MKNSPLNTILLACLIMLFIGACTKDGKEETIKLNVPFYATPGNRYTLHESALDSATGNNVAHTITIKCNSVADYRCFVADGLDGCCDNSSGGRANVVLEISKTQQSTFCDTLFFPGCTQGEEYDTTNVNIPTAYFDLYKVGLLKLDPWNNKAKKEKDYEAKLIIRKR